jgi:hypothetical protein
MEATYSSETSVDFQANTQRYIPEDSNCSELKLSLFLSTPPWRRMGGVQVILNAILTFAVDGGD